MENGAETRVADDMEASNSTWKYLSGNEEMEISRGECVQIKLVSHYTHSTDDDDTKCQPSSTLQYNCRQTPHIP